MSALLGHVRNGVVVFDKEVCLPEGTPVRVEPLETPSQTEALQEQLLLWSGKGKELPTDLARRHDHYLHGQED